MHLEKLGSRLQIAFAGLEKLGSGQIVSLPLSLQFLEAHFSSCQWSSELSA